MNAPAGPARWSGRREDFALLTGRADYVADIAVDGCVELAFVRSEHAHGRVVGVDLAACRRSPGVVAAYAAGDLPDLPPTSPTAANAAASAGRDRPSLAVDRVRFVGEPLAVVAGEDRYRAEDGAELADVVIEPLPAVLDPRHAAEPNAPELFPGLSNVALEHTVGRPEAAMIVDRCPMVIERDYVVPRVVHCSLEGRAILVVPEDGGMTVWCSHQAVHRLRDSLAAAFPELDGRLRVRTPAVGGAFGQKSHTYPEYVVAVAVALRLGRPVRWVEDRWEALIASAHGRGQRQRARLGADRDGRILAAEFLVDADLGAYPHVGAYVPTFTALMLSGPYAIESIHGVIRGVLTNKVPTCPYRGAGRPEAAYLLERTLDHLAGELGIDPAEVRRRNFIARDRFPYRTSTGAEYESGDYAAALERALELIGYDELRAEQRDRPADARRALGLGICSFVERSGGAVTTTEFASVEVAADGAVVARIGTTSTGQGHLTAYAEVVARALGVDPADVTVLQGDTAEVPDGTGTFASRSMQVGGAALHLAATQCREQLDGHDLGIASGGPRAHAEVAFESPRAFPSGSYVAAVEVDLDTGAVELRRLVAVDDCGRRIVPELVEGQTLGSIAQGVGQALYEEFRYDDDGQPSTSTLLDYLVPTAAELPPLVTDAIETPNPRNPLGAKGAGEGGCIGAPPAILNAVADALRHAGVRAHDVGIPATPASVWERLSVRPDAEPEEVGR